MPSLNDAFAELQAINTKLQALHADNAGLLAEQVAIKSAVDNGTSATQSVKASVDAAIGVLTAIAQGQQDTNTILLHLAEQTDTVICSLEHIARHTCGILNEAHRQTALQVGIAADTEGLLDIASTVNPAAALDRARRQQERIALEACCPPEAPRPACRHEPCPAPPKLPVEEKPDPKRGAREP